MAIFKPKMTEGGGNKFTAQVGGKDPSKLDSIISNLQKILSEHYK